MAADWTLYAAAGGIGLVIGFVVGMRIFLAQRRARMRAERERENAGS